MDIRGRFNQKYQTNPKTFGDQPMPIVERAVSYAPAGSALDLGVGNGRNTLFLLKQGYQVTGVDLSDEGLQLVKKQAGDNPNLKLRNIDATKFSSDEQFDLVLAIGLLHFLPKEKIDRLVAKMQTLTKIGGVNAIATRMTQNLRNDLPHIFTPDELKGYYLNGNWEILQYAENQTPRARIATLIAKKKDL